MKKTIYYALAVTLALSLTLGMTSCSDGGEDTNKATGNTEIADVSDPTENTPSTDATDVTDSTDGGDETEPWNCDVDGHIPDTDDGNCITEIKCAECGEILVAGESGHVDNDHDYLCDNGDCQITVDGAPKDENEGIDLPIVTN